MVLNWFNGLGLFGSLKFTHARFQTDKRYQGIPIPESIKIDENSSLQAGPREISIAPSLVTTKTYGPGWSAQFSSLNVGAEISDLLREPLLVLPLSFPWDNKPVRQLKLVQRLSQQIKADIDKGLLEIENNPQAQVAQLRQGILKNIEKIETIFAQTKAHEKSIWIKPQATGPVIEAHLGYGQHWQEQDVTKSILGDGFKKNSKEIRSTGLQAIPAIISLGLCGLMGFWIFQTAFVPQFVPP